MMSSLPGVVWLVIKLVVLLGLAIYAVFAGIIVRQEHLMAGVLEEAFEPILRIIAYGHLAAAIALFVAAFILL